MSDIENDAAHVAAVQAAMLGPHPVYVVWQTTVEKGAFTTMGAARAQVRAALLEYQDSQRKNFEAQFLQQLAEQAQTPDEYKPMGLRIQTIMVKA